MEKDRYQGHHKIFILGISCLLLSLLFIGFSFFVLPYLIWDLHYHVPAFILNLLAWLQDDYNFSSSASKFLVWLLFFIPGLITGYIAYYVSNNIDNQLYKAEINGTEDEDNEQILSAKTNEEIKESAGLGLKILFLMGLVFLFVVLFQGFMSATA